MINELFPLIKNKASYKQINASLNKIKTSVDDLLNVDAKNAEIAKLKG